MFSKKELLGIFNWSAFGAALIAASHTSDYIAMGLVAALVSTRISQWRDNTISSVTSENT